MKNIEIVKANLYTIFDDYLKGELHETVFKNKLYRLCIGSGKKSYWWRFFPNDTAANDYWSVNSSLNTHANTSYLKECIEIALRDRQLIVYYS